MIALIGMTIERKVKSSRRNAAVRTKAKTIGACDLLVSLKSFDSAVKPVTSAVTPGTAPIVAGMIVSRSWSTAALDLESVPLPATGMLTWITLRSGKVSSVIGGWNSGLAFARAASAAMPCLTCGVGPWSELTTTTAGIPPPGKVS